MEPRRAPDRRHRDPADDRLAPGALALGGFELQAEAALLVEHVRLRRLDLAQVSTHAHWDIGAAAGVHLAYRASNGLGLGIGALAGWFPAAETITIPAGPSARLSQGTVKWGFFVDWRRNLVRP